MYNSEFRSDELNFRKAGILDQRAYLPRLEFALFLIRVCSPVPGESFIPFLIVILSGVRRSRTQSKDPAFFKKCKDQN